MTGPQGGLPLPLTTVPTLSPPAKTLPVPRDKVRCLPRPALQPLTQPPFLPEHPLPLHRPPHRWPRAPGRATNVSERLHSARRSLCRHSPVTVLADGQRPPEGGEALRRRWYPAQVLMGEGVTDAPPHHVLQGRSVVRVGWTVPPTMPGNKLAQTQCLWPRARGPMPTGPQGGRSGLCWLQLWVGSGRLRGAVF